jgi:hypothetical protein
LILLVWNKTAKRNHDTITFITVFEKRQLDGNDTSDCPANRFASCNSLYNVPELIAIDISNTLSRCQGPDCSHVKKRREAVLGPD